LLSSRSLKSAVLGLAVLAPALLGGCDRQSDEKAQPAAAPSSAAAAPEARGQLDTSHKGEALPAVTLRDAAGRKLALASLAGKPLLVNLWATWCAPCVAELPTLDALAASHAADLRVLTVSQDMSGTEKVAEFLKARGGTRLEPWLDPKNDLAFHYQVTTLPTTILYDAKGREVWRYVGGHDWSGPDAAALIGQAQ
jgi:thiol-disulfide isomerase/thioredoxin